MQRINLKKELSDTFIELQKEKVLDAEPPSFVGGYINANQKHKILQKQVILLPSLGYYKIKELLVTGLGVCITSSNQIIHSNDIYFKAKYLESNILKTFKSSLNNKVNELDLNMKPIRRIEETCILLSQRGTNIYGHWLLDIIPKLTLIKHLIENGLKVILPYEIPGYAYYLMSKHGLHPDNIIKHDFLKEDLLCNELIIPTHGRFGLQDNIVHPSISLSYNSNNNNIAENPSRKIFLSRKNVKNQLRRLINRADIEERLVKLGYEIIYPESMTLESQIKLFGETIIMVGEFGSALHNSLFAPSSSKVVSLCGNHFINMVQLHICNALSQKSAYVFGEAFYRKNNRINADFIIEPNHLEAALEKT